MAVVQKIRCTVEKIIPYGEGVYTVDFMAERPVPRFRPGQFLHLALDPYDPSGFWPDSRVFSIASSPIQRGSLRISYSVRGRFTARMENELHDGQKVWIKLPYGEFVVDNTNDVVLFAGGTGITAFTAFLDGLKPDITHDVYLAYGARRRNLLIYRDMIEKRAREIPRLYVRYFIEEDGGLQPARISSEVREIRGLLSVAAIWPHLHNPKDSIYYLSGPPMMLKAISQELHVSGILEGAIKIDAWQ